MRLVQFLLSLVIGILAGLFLLLVLAPAIAERTGAVPGSRIIVAQVTPPSFPPAVVPLQPRPPQARPVQPATPSPIISPPFGSEEGGDGRPEWIRDLRARKLTLPVVGVGRDALRDNFYELREGWRVHDAIDILAPRNTPVIAVEDGRISKLFYSVKGGNTIYQFDPSETYCYYYAHLQKYADNLKQGQWVKRGQVIGYVGVSGGALPEVPT